MRNRLMLLAIAASGLLTVATAAQQPPPTPPPLIINSMVGRDMFEFYCATCHGKDGKGGGPVAAALKVPPADLTVLARQNRGVFPRPDVAAIIYGTARAVTAHGTSDMPMWGPIFRALDPSDVRAKVRIDNLVSYLESIQGQ